MDWTEINLPYGDVYDNAFDELDSFVKRGLNKPGTQIRTASGDEYLIGDINPLRGACDHCTAFGDDTVIAAYRVVWSAGT